MSSISKLLDPYTFKARFLPAWLALLPLHGVLLVLLPDIEGLIIAVVGPPPMAVLASSIARNLGKHVEDNLWEKAGGNPVVRFLRHRDNTLSDAIKQSYHAAATKMLKQAMPSVVVEERNPEKADETYELVGHRLRTGDHKMGDKRDHLLFSRNVEYGFARNCFGLKKAAILVAFLSLAFTLWSVIPHVFDGNLSAVTELPVPSLIFSTFLVFLIGVWSFYVTEKYVATASDAYAFRLLELLEAYNSDRSLR